jgi:hypothetical protein
LEKYDTRRITVQVYNDLNSEDQTILANSAPQLRGAVVAESKDGAKHEIVDFDIYTVRTECKYITLAKPAGAPPNVNVAPLGKVGEPTPEDRKAADINDLLISGSTNIVTRNTGQFPAVINPPFAVCQQTSGNAAVEDDDVAIYNIRGQITNLSELDGSKLNFELTVDLNQSPNDLAKITNNNNPYVKANLIADEDKSSAQKIGFTLHDLWTDCKDISLNNQPIFEPIISESNP